MIWFAVLLKWILILACFATGTAMLVAGLGAEIPALKFRGFEAYNVPAGAVLLLVGVGIAFFWRIRSEEVVTSHTIGADGVQSFVQTTHRRMSLFRRRHD